MHFSYDMVLRPSQLITKPKDKGKVLEIGNCEDVLTFENVFDSRVYNSIFHVGIFNL